MRRSLLDGADQRIIELLLEDGRRSASDIGREIGLRRRRRSAGSTGCEDLGVILGYQAVVDNAKLGNGVEAFAELRFEGATQVDDIDRAFIDLPELVEGFTIAGRHRCAACACASRTSITSSA